MCVRGGRGLGWEAFSLELTVRHVVDSAMGVASDDGRQEIPLDEEEFDADDASLDLTPGVSGATTGFVVHPGAPQDQTTLRDPEDAGSLVPDAVSSVTASIISEFVETRGVAPLSARVWAVSSVCSGPSAWSETKKNM